MRSYVELATNRASVSDLDAIFREELSDHRKKGTTQIDGKPARLGAPTVVNVTKVHGWLDRHFSRLRFAFSENDKLGIQHFEAMFSLWKDLRPPAAAARALLRKMRAECDDMQWEHMQTLAPGLEELRLILELHGGQFEKDTDDTGDSSKPRGPKPKRLDQKMAVSLANEILSTLRASGIGQEFTLTSPGGPVARIGAAIWTKATGTQIQPETFAARVAAGLKNSPPAS